MAGDCDPANLLCRRYIAARKFLEIFDMKNNGMSEEIRTSALEKSLTVLEAIAENPSPLGLPDLTAIVGFPRQTVHRVLVQLERNGLVLRDPTRDRFSIGPRCSRLALATLSSSNQSAPIQAILADLVADQEETCNVGVLDGMEYLYLARIECHWSLRVHLQAGSRIPAYCASGGKVMLAHLDDKTRRGLLTAKRLKARTPHTLTRVADLEHEFAAIREQGYALNNQEYSLGIIGVAVPVMDRTGRVLAALALHGPEPRIPLERAEAAVPKLQATAKRLARLWHLDDAGKGLAAGRKRG